MDSDDESDNHGPNDQFFLDSDVNHITTRQLGLTSEILDDLYTGESHRVTY